jgi:class 3 adenylate cyclase
MKEASVLPSVVHDSPAAPVRSGPVSRQQLRVVRLAGRGDAETHAYRGLAAILFVDIVSSTEKLVAIGDRAFASLIADFRAAVRHSLVAFRGREYDSAGDSFLATFDSASRALDCAARVHEAALSLGIAVRAGLHAGEFERGRREITGIAVHIGARVASLAGPNETLVSATVRDLVAGSGLRFDERGTHVLKGVPGQWRLYAAPRRPRQPLNSDCEAEDPTRSNRVVA